MAVNSRPLRLLGRGEPHRFRGNNAAVTGLMELQMDRYREVAGINRYRHHVDPNVTGRQKVAALIAQLGSADPDRQIAAIQRLSIHRDPAAAPALTECLADRNREVRVAAAVALAACGNRESVKPLFNALTDTDPLVAQAAAMAIENLTGHVRPFNAFADRTPRRQQAGSWRQWLVETGWQRIESELIGRLANDDRDVVRRATVALGHIGSEASYGPLRQYVLAQREVNPLPAWKKAGHRGDATQFNALADVNPRTLQAAVRSIGYLGDTRAVAMLAETLAMHDDPTSGNLFLAEAVVEALGRINTPEAESALIKGFGALQDYPKYTVWYGDHTALMACHASPIHYFILESLDAMGSTDAGPIVPHVIRSVPIDPDRALLLGNDDYESLVGRVIRRSGYEQAVVETCLSLLGDKNATQDPVISKAISTVHRCWAGHPGPENRAAQILSCVCRDGRYEPRVRAAFERYVAMSCDIPRVFDTGIPVVNKLPKKHWGCFYLARTLGNLANRDSSTALIAALESAPAEAASGRPDPLGPGVLFLHNDLTPCWQAAVAWALGRIRERQAVPILLKIVGDLQYATDTRHAAAVALGRIANPIAAAPLQRLAQDYPEISTRRAIRISHRACESAVHAVGRDRNEGGPLVQDDFLQLRSSR
jgi:HEAT repeat protein